MKDKVVRVSGWIANPCCFRMGCDHDDASNAHWRHSGSFAKKKSLITVRGMGGTLPRGGSRIWFHKHALLGGVFPI
jgi:hypothetical protein